MGNIPEDIKSGMQNLAKAEKVEVQSLLNELKEIIKTDDTIKSMAPEHQEFKIRYAFAILCRRHTSGQSTQMYIKPLSYSRFGTTKSNKNRIDLFAMVKRITTDDDGNDVIGETEFAAGTLWEKAAESAKKLSKDKVYKTSLTFKETAIDINNATFKGLEVSSNDTTFIETQEVQFPSSVDFYKAVFEPIEDSLRIELDEMDINEGKNRLDIRVIKAMIIDYQTGQRSDGSEFGYYLVSDNSMLGGGDGGKPGNYTFWVAPEEVEFEKGVTMKFVGAARHDTKNDVTRWNYYFGVPVGVQVKRKIEPKPVDQQKESVDTGELDLDDDDMQTSSEDDDIAV